MIENKFPFLLYITIRGLEIELAEVFQMKVALFYSDEKDNILCRKFK